MRNDNNGQQNCEVILYDPAVHPTATGDGLIVMQYALVANNDSDPATARPASRTSTHRRHHVHYYNRYAAGARTLAAAGIAFVPTASVGADTLTVEPAAITRTWPRRANRRARQSGRRGIAGTVLHYSVTVEPAASWLTFTPGSGQIAAGDDATVNVTLDATGLSNVCTRPCSRVLHRRNAVAVPVDLLVAS